MNAEHLLNDLQAPTLMAGAIVGFFLVLGLMFTPWDEREDFWKGFAKAFLVIWLFYAIYSGYDHLNGHPQTQETCEEFGRFGEFGACDDGPIP